MPNKKVIFEDLALLDYKTCWDYQDALFNKTVEQKISNRNNNTELPTPNYLLFVEHVHVYTLGKSGDDTNLLINENIIVFCWEQKSRMTHSTDNNSFYIYLST